MSRHDPKVTLRQITDYALRAQELCAQHELPAILTDWQKRAAFERVMEVLGEAVKRLPAELTARYPSAGMRDPVSHRYDAIDYATLWDIVQDDIPGLLATVGQMLEDLDSGDKR
jgi:uncharacterized protein with HEPN domain